MSESELTKLSCPSLSVSLAFSCAHHSGFYTLFRLAIIKIFLFLLFRYVEEHIQRTGVAIETQGFSFVTNGRKRESLTVSAAVHFLFLRQGYGCFQKARLIPSSLKCQPSAPCNSDLLLWTKMSSMFLEYLMSCFANYLWQIYFCFIYLFIFLGKRHPSSVPTLQTSAGV